MISLILSNAQSPRSAGMTTVSLNLKVRLLPMVGLPVDSQASWQKVAQGAVGPAFVRASLEEHDRITAVPHCTWLSVSPAPLLCSPPLPPLLSWLLSPPEGIAFP